MVAVISSANMFRVVAVINGRCDLRVIGALARLKALAVLARASVTAGARQLVGAMGCLCFQRARGSLPDATRCKFSVAFGEGG